MPSSFNNQLSSICSRCSQLLCQQCEIIHPSEHNQSILPLSEAASHTKLALIGRFASVNDGDRSRLDQTFDGVVEAIQDLYTQTEAVSADVTEYFDGLVKVIQDLHTQTEAVSADVTEYFDGLVKVIRKRENEVLNDLDQLRTKKLLPLEAQRSRLANTINASSTAKSYLKSRQADANILEMNHWLGEVAGREARQLREDGAPCASAKFAFTPNTSTDMVDVLRQFGIVTDVAVSSSLAPLQSPTGVRVDSAQQEIPDQRIFNTFNPEKCHPNITLDNDKRTASVTAEEDRYQCVLGATIHTTGQHDIRIRLDDMQDYSDVVIGMTSNTEPPLDECKHRPGLSEWCGWQKYQYIPTCSSVFGGDVGQPWKTGDILHLHAQHSVHEGKAVSKNQHELVWVNGSTQTGIETD